MWKDFAAEGVLEGNDSSVPYSPHGKAVGAAVAALVTVPPGESRELVGCAMCAVCARARACSCVVMCMCMCVRVRVRVRARVRVRVHVRMHVRVHVRVCVRGGSR